jgi:hypothetical protein
MARWRQKPHSGPGGEHLTKTLMGIGQNPLQVQTLPAPTERMKNGHFFPNSKDRIHKL